MLDQHTIIVFPTKEQALLAGYLAPESLGDVEIGLLVWLLCVVIDAVSQYKPEYSVDSGFVLVDN